MSDPSSTPGPVQVAPPDEMLTPAVSALIGARLRRGRWATSEGDFVTDMVAIAFAAVPDGWAKVDGAWVYQSGERDAL